MTCPICRRPARPRHEENGPGNRHFPFCSEHCKLVDLAKWMGEEYRIPGPPATETLTDPQSMQGDDEPIVH